MVTNLADIAQSIRLILGTPKGTVPLDPDFGCDLYRYLDRPIDRARAPVVREAMRALREGEPRIVVERVRYTVDTEAPACRARLRVAWHVRDGVLRETEVRL